MEKFPLIVSYYTPDSIYSKAADALKKSLERFGLEYDIECRPPAGNWHLNAAQKVVVIKDMLVKHSGRNLLWIDADSEVVAYPHLMQQFEADLATLWWNGVFDTTTYISNNSKMVKFFDELIKRNSKSPYQWEASQATLNQMICEPHDLDYKHLPATYGWVPGESILFYNTVEPPVILTYLASKNRKGGRGIYPGMT
jgi:hypothetical protein